jgi:pyruvate,water dikinase
VDIEWAFDGKKLWFLQLRSITGSSVQQVYSNRMAREMLPGQIKPLVWSVNIPLVNGTKIRILEEITGKLDVRPEQLAKAFHYRTYFNLAALSELFGKVGFSAESLEAMMTSENVSMSHIRPGIKSLRHIFRFVRFIYSKLGFENYFIRHYEILRKDLENLKTRVTHDFSVGNYPVLYEAVFQAAGKAAYMNVFIPLLMRMYDKKLRKKLTSLKLEYGILDFNRDFPLLPSFSPHQEMEKVRMELHKIPAQIIEKCEMPDQLADYPEARPFLLAFRKFLEEFGHLSESGNDFSVEKWEENPGFMFQLIRKLPVQPSADGLKSIRDISIPLIRRRSLLKSYGKAGRFRLYREQISSLYIFGYGLFRSLFLQMGDELVKAGILPQRNDVFFLTREEIGKILEKGLEVPQPEYAGIAAMRKKEMDDVKDMVLPSVIIGEEAPAYDMDEKKSFRGVGTSPGRYTGKISVISGISDFDKMEKGDVLVIPFSDVSWTPILVHAGAIISGGGGILSHCSIIAREMSIPAIVSVDDALCLKDGMRVTEDGSNGIITIYGDH